MNDTMDEKKAGYEDDFAEDNVLEKLGYEPELKRDFSLLGIVAFSFSIVTCWSALSGVLLIGVQSGGPPVMVWSWLGISIATLAVAYSMAEMCSAYPVAGGQYSWVAVFAPKKLRRGMSYVCGWFMLIGILAMGATNNFLGANFILGAAVLNNPDYTIQRWHTVLVAWLIGVVALAFNVFVPRLLEKVSRGFLFWNIFAFVIIIIVPLAMNDHKRPASFVFSDFVNFTGFPPAYTAICGLLQAAFGMCCYDAPAHMTEEIKHARKQAPRAIVLSVWLGGITGFIFLITFCFCIGDIESTALTPTLVPVIQVFYDSTQSVVGATCLTVLLIVICFGGANALTAEGGRAVYAFARDRGLPFSDVWSKVESKKRIPVYALCLTLFVQVVLDAVYFGTVTGFYTVISIATEGFYVSFALPLLARLLSLFTSSPHKKIGGVYSLGRFSIPLNIIGTVFLLFLSITFNFPGFAPVNSGNMNYTSAAVGAIMLISVVTWFTTGHKHFRGPESGGVYIEGGGGEIGVAVPVDEDEKMR